MKAICNLLGIILLLSPVSLLSQEPVKVNTKRLEASILDLGKIGVDDKGTQRVAFSDADIQGREFVVKLMRAAGLEVSIDFAGNIIGKRAGRDNSLPTIAFGSHIDTVPNGGNYDGCVGSLAAIELINILNENKIVTNHPLEVIIFSNEEGGVMGSRAISGELPQEALSVVNSTGYSMGAGIKRLGGDPDRLSEVVRSGKNLLAFLELHIEQGGNLDQEGIDIGIVEGIVGLNWWDVTFTGFANHAGTTPMNNRKDALLAAAKFIQATNESALSLAGRQVATVGRISAYPGAPNVIPGQVVLSLEIRDLSTAVIQQLFNIIKEKAAVIAEESGVKIEFEALSTTGKPALTDPEIQEIIEASAKELELSYMYMPSGAGHDAQDMAIITPTAMIFIPSKAGISHSPQEFSSAADIANGANVLLSTILKLDAPK
ncbi:Zn-dependent hydrolase [Gilvibacter sp.]|uniref:Zn-dependent hydrolase n=1 Tax=Gilvibacter sp. TaxID=2729997 RepID=UPI0035BE7840